MLVTRPALASCRREKDTAKPQFISEFSVKASRPSTNSGRDGSTRNAVASSSDRAEPRRFVLYLYALGRSHRLPGTSAEIVRTNWDKAWQKVNDHCSYSKNTFLCHTCLELRNHGCCDASIKIGRFVTR